MLDASLPCSDPEVQTPSLLPQTQESRHQPSSLGYPTLLSLSPLFCRSLQNVRHGRTRLRGVSDSLWQGWGLDEGRSFQDVSLSPLSLSLLAHISREQAEGKWGQGSRWWRKQEEAGSLRGKCGSPAPRWRWLALAYGAGGMF